MSSYVCVFADPNIFLSVLSSQNLSLSYVLKRATLTRVSFNIDVFFFSNRTVFFLLCLETEAGKI